VITNAIFHVLAVTLAFMIGLLPSFGVPSWMSTLPAAIGSGIGQVLQLGWWIPFSAIGIAATFILAVWATAFAIRAGRIVLSAFIGGGGSAA